MVDGKFLRTLDGRVRRLGSCRFGFLRFLLEHLNLFLACRRIVVVSMLRIRRDRSIVIARSGICVNEVAYSGDEVKDEVLAGFALIHEASYPEI